MKRSFTISSVTEELGKDLVSRNVLLLTFISGLIILGVVLAVLSRLPNRVPLLLTNPWGEERLVAKQWLLATPVLIWGIAIFNLMLGKSWGGEEKLVPRVLAISSLVVALMIMTALWGMLQSFFL